MRQTEHVSTFNSAVADSEPLLVDGKELRVVHTVPQRCAVNAQCLDPVNVGGQHGQPMRERAGDAKRSRVLPGPTRCGSGCSRSSLLEGANLECAENLLRERYAVKILFLGIFAYHRQGIWNQCFQVRGAES